MTDITAAPAAAAPASGTDTGAAKPADSLIASAKPAGDGVAPGAAAPATLEEVKAFLTGKDGIKAEDLAGLTEQQLRAKYDQIKAAAGEKKPEGEKAKPGEIEFKIPDGFTIEEKAFGEFKGVLADANLSPQDRGQKLLEMHVAALKATQQSSDKLWTDTQTKWQGEVKADPEMGGQNYDSTLELVAKAIDALGGKEAQKMRDAFNFTGAGNHPEMVRLMRRVGALVSEGKHVAGKSAGDDGSQKSAAEKLYPSHA